MKATKVILFLIPFIWSAFLIPFTNRIEPFVLGMPFIMFWQIAGVFVASLCLAGLYHIDKREEAATVRDEGGAAQ